MDKSKNKNTTKATKMWMNVYQTGAKHREVLEIEKIELLKKLDEILQHFFTELKKQDIQDYEPKSLCSLQALIDRFLHQRGYMHSILKSKKFASSKAILQGKA